MIADRGAATGVIPRTKEAKLERPKIDLDATDEKWGLFLTRWNRYVWVSQLTDVIGLKDELMMCLEEPLEKAVVNKGINDLATIKEMLDGVKKMAVKKHNTMVNRVKFQDLGQEDRKPVKAYLPRLRAAAAVCDFQKKCHGCQTMVDFTDSMLATQLVRGLVDPDFQTKVLQTQAEKTEEPALKDVVAQVEALEMGKGDQSYLKGQGNVGLHRQAWGNDSRGGNDPPQGPKCGSCGRKGHKQGDSSCTAKDNVPQV